MMRKLKRLSIVQIIAAPIMLVYIVISVYPLIWMAMSSIKPPWQFVGNSMALPEMFFYENFINAWVRGQFNVYYINSVIITVGGIAVILVLGSMAGFAIEKMRWRLSQVGLRIFLSGIMIPAIMLLLPQVLIYMRLGLFNNLTAVIAALAMGQLPISVYLFSTFYRFFPNEVIESAVIDGCSIYQVFLRIVMPLTRNTVMTVIICSFFVFWNDFIAANTFTTRNDLKTIQVGVSLFVGNFTLTEWGPIFAGLTIATLPTVILYLFLNKQVLTGVAEGSIKG